LIRKIHKNALCEIAQFCSFDERFSQWLMFTFQVTILGADLGCFMLKTHPMFIIKNNIKVNGICWWVNILKRYWLIKSLVVFMKNSPINCMK